MRYSKKNGNRIIQTICYANMRELSQTGFMSNRGRQNVANYLTKELKIDWRVGAEYFESLLIDYDVHSNYGNWLYNSGIGNDPMPFRKFNVKFQSEKYDEPEAKKKLIGIKDQLKNILSLSKNKNQLSTVSSNELAEQGFQ